MYTEKTEIHLIVHYPLIADCVTELSQIEIDCLILLKFSFVFFIAGFFPF